MIQLVDRKQLIFRIKNEEYMYIKPKYLMKDFGKLIEAKVKGSTMGWYLNNEFVSYNKLKNTLTTQ